MFRSSASTPSSSDSGRGSTSKRSLSESSNGSSASDDQPPSFKIPKKTPSMAPQEQHHPYFSQISGSRSSISEDEDSGAGNELRKAIESTSSGTEDDSSSQASNSPVHSSMNGSMGAYYGGNLAPKEETEVPKAASVSTQGSYSSMAQRMMAKMGHQEGKGLGKKGQGRVEPVGLSSQRGRRGLGLIIKGLEEDTTEWDSSKEHVVVEEEVKWMKESGLPPPTLEEMREWRREGPRKETIDDATTFCDSEILANVVKCKSVFDNLEGREMRRARTKSNPFETIHRAIFLNRAAMKMANMDAVFQYMFTQPKNRKDQPLLGPHDILYFADVCAGPGGFSEYVLWRKKWRCKGFGFTLRGPNDFKLEDFFAGPPETFETHYGVNGRDGDGDVFREDNIKAFREHVLSGTQGLGVHFMMADGGFCVEGNENIQEILSKQLYLCQFIVALGIVRTGGHFVCKLFDLFTPFSVGLVYLMYRAFDVVCLQKPNTSRPANSERYIICKGKRPGSDTEPIYTYMLEINQRLNQLGMTRLGNLSSQVDVNEIVPLEMMQADRGFMDYIIESNNLMGEWQIIALAKIAAFARNRNLVEERQSELTEQCLHFWNVPNEARRAKQFDRPQNKITELFGANPKESSFMAQPGRTLRPGTLPKFVKSPYDWKFVLLGNLSETGTERSFFLGLGRTAVYQFIPHRNFWEKTIDQYKFELPAGTLIFAEIVREIRGEAKSGRTNYSLHIIDGAFIGGEDIRGHDLKTRLFMLQTMAKAVNKESHAEFIELRVKELFRLESLNDVVMNFSLRRIKGGGGMEKFTHNVVDAQGRQDARYFVPAGIMLTRIVREPYTIAMSKKAKRKYWFDQRNGKSAFECPMDALVTFRNGFENRLLWPWEEGVKLIEQQPIPANEEKLQGEEIFQHILSLTGAL